MSEAIIHYKRIIGAKNTIKILGIENVYDKDTIYNILGKKGAEIYLYNGDPCFYKDKTKYGIKYTIDGNIGKELWVGQTISKDNFGRIIKALKIAGTRFVNIAIEIKRYQKKSINI